MQGLKVVSQYLIYKFVMSLTTSYYINTLTIEKDLVIHAKFWYKVLVLYIMLTNSPPTDDSSIIRVVTVMNTKWVTATVHKSGLRPSTLHIVQKKGSSSLAKVGTRLGDGTLGDKYAE